MNTFGTPLPCYVSPVTADFMVYMYTKLTGSAVTAILAVATRHRFREAHFACLQQVHNHLDTILSRDRKRPWLPTIQALCTLAFWKESTDDGGWRRLGFAIRLAYEEGLHKLPKDVFSSLDKHGVRLALDRHRTWLCKFKLGNLKRFS